MTSVRPKTAHLQAHGVLNSHPERVTNEPFLKLEFFDQEDLVQVKYEMLRMVQKENVSVAQAAKQFGFTRPVFYQALADFRAHGLAGLLPKKTGPRGGHKLTNSVVDYLEKMQAQATCRLPDLVMAVKDKFGITVHQRSIERVLMRPQKKRHCAKIP